MTPSAIENTARKLLDHRARGLPNPVPPEAERLADLDLAYAIQEAGDRLRRAAGQAAIGYKIAGTNPASRRHLRIEAPFFGRLYDGMASASPAHLPHDPFFRVHEPEIALQMGRDLDPRGAPFDAAAIAAATRAVVPAIEIIGTPFTPWAEAGAPNLASDNAAFGHWIMGTPILDWSGLDLLEGEVTLAINGAIVARGQGRMVDGGAFGATAWLANALAARGQGLRAGDCVTTGSVTPPVAVAPGQHVVADFGALGVVECRIGD
jgi:2-keto-4-pentenoate hydratase